MRIADFFDECASIAADVKRKRSAQDAAASPTSRSARSPARDVAPSGTKTVCYSAARAPPYVHCGAGGKAGC